jgi:hypothetical protein
MLKGKGEYLKQLTSRLRIKSLEVGRNVEGSTPPSVFIGSWNYPKVYAGPMVTPFHGDTSLFDSPESWIPRQITTSEIVDFRLSLIRGKQEVKINDLDDGLVGKLREIALSKESVQSDVEFKHVPRGNSFSDEHAPHGPSAAMEDFEIEECRWQHDLEKAYYDSDLKAGDAVAGLYENGVSFSRIQKAFSVGVMGLERRRRLVPTRWSITACDTILADTLLSEVRHNEVIERVEVYESNSLHNYYAVILLPTAWQYEWTEAFIHVLGSEEMFFSDHENNRGKRGYSTVGGCYYSCKFGVLEALARAKKQAGAIVLREAGSGYIPLGVFNVRENVRNAMKNKPLEFNTLMDALRYLEPKFRLPLARFMRESTLLKENLHNRQTTLVKYA